jgi:phosphoglycerate-specific signal transduction histidine kinase
VQIYAAGRINVEVAALKLGMGTDASALESAAKLLNVAGRAMEKFRKQSTLCLNLVRNKPGLRESVHVNSVIEQIEGLLATEARINKVTLIKSGPTDAMNETDRLLLEKCLLRVFLEGLRAAVGNILNVEILPQLDGASIEIVLASHSDNDKSKSCGVVKIDGTGKISMENRSKDL